MVGCGYMTGSALCDSMLDSQESRINFRGTPAPNDDGYVLPEMGKISIRTTRFPYGVRIKLPYGERIVHKRPRVNVYDEAGFKSFIERYLSNESVGEEFDLVLRDARFRPERLGGILQKKITGTLHERRRLATYPQDTE